MRAVVTGGAGFLGSHLCERLLEGSFEVVCIDNFLTGSARNVEHLVDRDGFELVDQDATEHIDVDGEVDRVFHFASPASPISYIEYGIQTLKVGALGTHNTLGLARKKNARFLLASTSEVYGDPAVHPQTEDYWGNVNPVGVRSVYDEAKRFAEAMAMAYHRTHGMDVKIVRIFNTYGPRMDIVDGRVVPEFMRAALTGRPLVVHGDGTQTRSYCYVDDLIDGIALLMESGHNGPMNIGNPDELSVTEFAQRVLEITGSDSSVTFGPRPPDDPTMRCPDIALAKRVLGWEPKVSLDEGLRKAAGYFADELKR